MKAGRTPFDPARHDPFIGLGYDPNTGKPFLRHSCPKAHKPRAKASLEMRLDNEVLNDARRHVAHRFLRLLVDYFDGRVDERDVLAFLRHPSVGNRAVLRELILEPRLVNDGIIIEEAAKRIPGLVAWAQDPLRA